MTLSGDDRGLQSRGGVMSQQFNSAFPAILLFLTHLLHHPTIRYARATRLALPNMIALVKQKRASWTSKHTLYCAGPCLKWTRRRLNLVMVMVSITQKQDNCFFFRFLSLSTLYYEYEYLPLYRLHCGILYTRMLVCILAYFEIPFTVHKSSE